MSLLTPANDARDIANHYLEEAEKKRDKVDIIPFLERLDQRILQHANRGEKQCKLFEDRVQEKKYNSAIEDIAKEVRHMGYELFDSRQGWPFIIISWK